MSTGDTPYFFSPDGKKLALNRVFRQFRTWKYYQGGMADDVWIYDFNTQEIANITGNPAQDVFPHVAWQRHLFSVRP
ncbi:MAG: hypothetical protein U5L72_19515 [Bacteroidales bacterium]|nr:hypothetical protein [Bacteroidales bacterium]